MLCLFRPRVYPSRTEVHRPRSFVATMCAMPDAWALWCAPASNLAKAVTEAPLLAIYLRCPSYVDYMYYRCLSL